MISKQPSAITRTGNLLSNFKNLKMIKKIIIIAIITGNALFFSCTNQDNEEIETYQKNIELYGTGGEKEKDNDTKPPIDPPTTPKTTGN